MKLISFVVPCYNSQEYMRHCIDTLLPGGYQVEILIVNDGSSDNTAAIADEYEKKYPDICRAIHQENKGHGGAVNTGIKNATGIYLKVVDRELSLICCFLTMYMKNKESRKKLLFIIVMQSQKIRSFAGMMLDVFLSASIF